ncbi:MAG: hypothetical protein QNJ57_00835 [Flavobacteriaceae bacterium]|nr:hypothetical protein [Flavobacteriaceae bacterium]
MKSNKNRRSFIQKIVVSLIGLGLIPKTAWSHLSVKNCSTGSDQAGPFYRKGAPTRYDLTNGKKVEGVSLIVSGTIYDSDCQTPISNAELDIWHAGHSGKYDNSSTEFMFRGIIITDDRGKYEFKTVLPGLYDRRPRHIHFKVRHKEYRALTTQLSSREIKGLILTL